MCCENDRVAEMKNSADTKTILECGNWLPLCRSSPKHTKSGDWSPHCKKIAPIQSGKNGSDIVPCVVADKNFCANTKR